MTRAEKDEKKDASKDRPKASSRNLRKKRGGRNGGDDDDDVDSSGNIRGLIAYSDETEEEESPRVSRRGFKPRKAAVAAKEKIRAKKE